MSRDVAEKQRAWPLSLKVTYEGLQRYRNVDTGIDETLIDRRKQKTVQKEESSVYVEQLVPQTVYIFNITASFLDGSTGPVTTLHVETSSEGLPTDVSSTTLL